MGSYVDNSAYFHGRIYFPLMDSIDKTIIEIFALYTSFGGNDYIGEPVSQLEHMSQAAELAMKAEAGDELVLAAFFHDIGHLCVARDHTNDMDGYGTVNHEKVGADYLRSKGFPEVMALLVESHVSAKRYLTYKYPAYLEDLSEASKKTLAFQGGIMNAAEAEAFEKNPLFDSMILLRKWDEQAKEEKKSIVDLDLLKAKARNVLLNN